MNPFKLIRSKIDLSRLPAVIVLPNDARRTARKVNVRASQALHMPISTLVKRAASIDRHIEELARRGDTDQTWVVVAVVNDLALTLASRVTAHKGEATLKVLYLCDHRAAFGESTATQPAMFDAAIDHECARWGLSRPDQLEQLPAALH